NTTVNLGTTAGAPPVINKRKAQTEVLIKEGERLVIGGVTTNLDQDETRKIPLFGDIPVIGWMFKQTASQTVGRELVVFITPSVLKVDTAQATTPKKWSMSRTFGFHTAGDSRGDLRRRQGADRPGPCLAPP